MPLFRPTEVRARARRATTLYKAVDAVLLEHVREQVKIDTHDIFMSHAFDDKELVLGTTLTIEDMGYTVYLDWRDDPSLDRKRVSPATAEKLRVRMRKSRSLFFATTEHASESKWMPWELGFMDGHNTRAAILPFSETTTDSFEGQEYLGVYPYVSDGTANGSAKKTLWIHRSPKIYTSFEAWLKGGEPTQHQ